MFPKIHVPVADSTHQGLLKICSEWIDESEVEAILDLERIKGRGISVEPIESNTSFGVILIENHHVVKIDLHNDKIDHLPDSIKLLTHLRKLNLQLDI
ncbi:MAG: hypothetical protein ACTSWL_07540, partial [Promethearchaeota archaeon]